MSDLNNQKLHPCDETCESLSEESIDRLIQGIPDWQLITENGIHKLSHCYRFNNFSSALAFCNKIAALAEEVNHHPLLCIEWGKLQVYWWTHQVDGLHINDFIMAARCDGAYLASQEKRD